MGCNQVSLGMRSFVKYHLVTENWESNFRLTRVNNDVLSEFG